MFGKNAINGFRAACLSLALITGGMLAEPAAANSSMPSEGIRDPERVLPFAKKVERALAERGAHVAIVARVGRDPESLPGGIDYTHVGIWVYSDIETEDGKTVRGYAVHNLYQFPDDLSRSSLVEDFPPDFFADVYAMKAGVIIPEPALQQRLVELVSSPSYKKLHVEQYSLVANPFRRDYQNCTNFVLNVVTSAIHGTDDPAKVQSILRSEYQPRKIELNGLQRTFGPIFVSGFETNDHDGEIRTTTFGSLRDYLDAKELVQTAFVIEE